MPIKIESDNYTCISCGLKDKTVEAGGIYYCPNPFCSVSGATNWKINNLHVQETSSGVELLSTDNWLEKGMAAINGMPYKLASKIMRLEKTKKVIDKLNGVTKKYEIGRGEKWPR